MGAMGMPVVEYKHHQCHEQGMQNIWCPNPYCWLLCTQFLQACKKQSAKDDFWFRLRHFFDQFKDAANRSSNRLSAAHEINLTFAIHHSVLDDNLRQMMRDKIVKGEHYPDASNWSVQLGALEQILANWNEWHDTIQWIIPHVESRTQMLMIFYKWQTPIKSYTNDRDEIPPVQTIPWGHATTIESGLQIINTGGIRPSATVDESGGTYHWRPSFYCRINGKLVDTKIDHHNYVSLAKQTILHCRKKTPNEHRPITFHGIANARQRHLTIGTGGTAAEYTASLFYDVIHGHAHRWLVKSHVATLMGFAI